MFGVFLVQILCLFILSYSRLFLFYFVLFYYLGTCLFPKEEQKGYISRGEKRLGAWRSWDSGNHNQTILYKKNLFSLK